MKIINNNNPMTKFKTFAEIVDVMPYALRSMTKDLRGLRERPDYHPEESAYEHVKIVTERLLSLSEGYTFKWDLVVAAIFHDLGKRIKAKPNEKLKEKFGFAPPTSPGHDKFGAEMVVLYKDWILETFGVSHEPAEYVCAQHMRISSFPNMRISKKDAFMKDTYFSELCVFHKADDMMSNFSEENMYDYYKESKALIQKNDEKRISW